MICARSSAVFFDGVQPEFRDTKTAAVVARDVAALFVTVFFVLFFKSVRLVLNLLVVSF